MFYDGVVTQVMGINISGQFTVTLKNTNKEIPAVFITVLIFMLKYLTL